MVKLVGLYRYLGQYLVKLPHQWRWLWDAAFHGWFGRSYYVCMIVASIILYCVMAWIFCIAQYSGLKLLLLSNHFVTGGRWNIVVDARWWHDNSVVGVVEPSNLFSWATSLSCSYLKSSPHNYLHSTGSVCQNVNVTRAAISHTALEIIDYLATLFTPINSLQ